MTGDARHYRELITAARPALAPTQAAHSLLPHPPEPLLKLLIKVWGGWAGPIGRGRPGLKVSRCSEPRPPHAVVLRAPRGITQHLRKVTTGGSTQCDGWAGASLSRLGSAAAAGAASDAGRRGSSGGAPRMPPARAGTAAVKLLQSPGSCSSSSSTDGTRLGARWLLAGVRLGLCGGGGQPANCALSRRQDRRHFSAPSQAYTGCPKPHLSGWCSNTLL